MLTRRALLGSGLAAMLLPLAGAVPAGKNLVVVLAWGGWDVTFCFDPKSPDLVDGPFPDQDPEDPLDVESVQVFSGIPIQTNPSRRPGQAEFFEVHGHKLTVVNGVQVGALNHFDGINRILTGSAIPGRPGLNTMMGQDLGGDYPLGMVDLSSNAKLGAYASAAARVGTRGQLAMLLDPAAQPPSAQLAQRPHWRPSPADSAGIQAYLQRTTQDDLAKRGQHPHVEELLGHRLTSLDRAARLRTTGGALTASIPTNNNNTLGNYSPTVAALLAEGVCNSVLVDSGRGWDTHKDSVDQHQSYDRLFKDLDHLIEDLESAGVMEHTTVVVLSEMSRTPRRNRELGTDHWPNTSAMLFGAGVQGGRVLGATDDNLLALPIDLNTGAPQPTGTILTHEHLVAGILALMGVDPERWLPGVPPLRLR